MTLLIAAAMVSCWLLGILHPAMVGFIGLFLFAAGGVDFDTAFHGFGTETPWFLYGALLLAGAADRSGLLRFIGARTPRAFLRSPLVPVLTLIVLAYALAFAVPSSLARATILIVLAMSWAANPGTREPRNPGTPEARNPRTAEPLVLVAAYAAAIFGHPDVAGGPFAILGWDIAAGIALLLAVMWHARREIRSAATPAIATATGSDGVNPKVAAPLILAVVLWLATPWHGVAPALIGLACGLICLLPGIAPAGERALKPDHLAVIFAGAAITIPAVLLETKAVDTLTSAWQVNQSIGMLPAALTGYWNTIVYRMFSPDGARPPLPPLGDLPGSTAIWSYGGSTLFSLHQSPALILGMAVGGCRARHVLTTGLFVLIAGSVVVMLF